MNTLDALFTRKSIRTFTDQPISEADMHTILEAGMSGPVCCNCRDWSFIVVTDKEKMNKMADINGRVAELLRKAAACVLVCGDLERAKPRYTDFWAIDASIAIQNMTLAAWDLGIGSCWLGTWPLTEKVNAQAKLFDLPPAIVPHSIIAFGYPDEQAAAQPVKPNWEEDRVHFEKW